MKKTSAFFVIFLFPLLTTIAQGKKTSIDKIMRDYHAYNMFDGSVLVAENGVVIYKNAFGMANREWNIPNTTDTKFMIGSVSKPLTSTLALIMVQKGLLDTAKHVSDYLPEYPVANGGKITIAQLMSHSSGIPNYDIIPDFFPRISRQYYLRKDYLKLFMDSALAFEPGTSYSYSSWGYFTLGYILEKVSGKSYAQLMKEEIFDKIGMQNSGSYYHKQIVPRRATGYDYSISGYKSSDFRDQSNTMGTGDIYSTVEDLFKFHLALSKNTLLNKTLTRQMFTPGIKPWGYGYGWFNQNFSYYGTDSVFANYHLGMTDGFLSFLVRIPATNSLIVFLCNSSPTDFFGIARNLISVLYNKPAKVKRPIHKIIEAGIRSQSVTEAIKQYDALKKDTANYYLSWWNIDQVGHELFDLERYDDALIIFEKNALEFPQRDLVQMSLGQVYEALGRKGDAITRYKKAIEISPNYEEAKNRLKKLMKE